ncbi:MAG TPA: hypothetical protein PKX30_01310 [Candidatus Pacearchaeota archaeon]|nr:hypothetical protein [Candidatus Pacearchaeota archaeon]
MKKILLSLALFGLAFAPLAMAQNFNEPVGGGTTDTGGIPKPDFIAWVNTVARVIFILLVFAAIIFILVAGFNLATSQGDTKKMDQAKLIIFYAVMGIVISALAYGLVQWILKKFGGSIT